MPVSDMIRLGTAPGMTNQQLADLALQADHERRRAIMSGDLTLAVMAQRERNALCALIGGARDERMLLVVV